MIASWIVIGLVGILLLWLLFSKDETYGRPYGISEFGYHVGEALRWVYNVVAFVMPFVVVYIAWKVS